MLTRDAAPFDRLGALFVAPVLCVFALSAFAVSVLFGFLLQMPVPRTWEVLGFSVLSMGVYFAYRAVTAFMRALAAR